MLLTVAQQITTYPAAAVWCPPLKRRRMASAPSTGDPYDPGTCSQLQHISRVGEIVCALDLLSHRLHNHSHNYVDRISEKDTERDA